MKRWVLVAVVVLGACSSSNTKAPSPAADVTTTTTTTTTAKVALTTPAQVAAALTAGGFECSAFKDRPLTGPDAVNIGTDYRAAAGECQHAGKGMKLSTYADSRHVTAQLAEDDGLGCSIGASFGIIEFNLAYGDTWSTEAGDPLDQGAAQQMATILGGKTHHKVCPKK